MVEKVYCIPVIDDKFNSPGEILIVIKEQTDMFLQLWVKNKIEKGSILFLPRLYRWWTVEKVDENNLLYCVPTEIQPGF